MKVLRRTWSRARKEYRCDCWCDKKCLQDDDHDCEEEITEAPLDCDHYMDCARSKGVISAGEWYLSTVFASELEDDWVGLETIRLCEECGKKIKPRKEVEG